MARNDKDLKPDENFVARFSLAGLVTFSTALVLAGGLLAYGIKLLTSPEGRTGSLYRTEKSSADLSPTEVPPWGELATADITLEAPEEYVGFELKNVKPAAWNFANTQPEQVRAVMVSCGLEPAQIDRALSPALASVTGGGTVVHPDEALVFSLKPGSRARLYRALSKLPDNHYMQFPFVFPGQTFEECFRDHDVPHEIEEQIRRLTYVRGDAKCFSDFEIVMQQLASTADKIALLKTLSRQSAVIARLRVRPDSDVEKILGYWSAAPGVRVKDLRPLLESMTRIPEGSTISVLYLLPPFARQRLYTFPLAGQQNDPVMDCHWSTMNFFNEVPDNRFTDTAYTVAYLRSNYYTIAKPSNYGDIILFLDNNGNAIHSAVYIAADLVFTKNGNNFAQPWKLTHLKSLTARYELDAPERLMVWRRKDS
ncbi:MAG: hypothetical protein U1F65_08770 [Verrucomicrobiota bacterium]